MYNYETKTAVTLQGHQYAVRTISVTNDGKWLLSADFEIDPVVVIWDTESGVPICTLFNPHGESHLSAARISPNAKYIVTVGNERYQKVYFWLWTYGKDEPNVFLKMLFIASVELTETCLDRVKEITFNEDLPEEFALTTENSVVFLTWEQSKLTYYCPRIAGNVRRYGTLNCSCYLSKVQRMLTATSHGYVLIWCETSEKTRSKDKGKMKHIKSVRLQKYCLTVIQHHKGMVVVGTAVGRINFYDLELKLLYWCNNYGLDSIRSIGFTLESSLLGPVASDSTSTYDSESAEEGEEQDDPLQSTLCAEKIKLLKLTEGTTVPYQQVDSTITLNVEYMYKDHEKKHKKSNRPHQVPLDATFENAPFHVDPFLVSSTVGAIALLDIPALKCRLLFQDVGAPITSLAAHPRSNYIVTGNAQGLLSLYQYEKRKLIVRRKTPPVPDFHVFLDKQAKTGNIRYVTCPQSYDSVVAVSVLRYSPLGKHFLVCGLDNGTLWILHPITLEPIHNIPYKHSTEAILQLAFTECAEYMAYSDNTLVVAVFKRNHGSFLGDYLWDFLGKYHTHMATITDILFGPATPISVAPQLFSLGEDKRLVEYDLKNSGPYPEPGLMISAIYQIECTATPLCLAWYPDFSIEKFLMISNSEYKYRLLNDVTKMIRGTFLGPIFGAPVHHFEVLRNKELKKNQYVIFVTEKEIGLQIIPFDGDPYKILGMIGHPRKITNTCVDSDGTHLFTSGYNDHCVLMWKIKCRSVDILAHQGGNGLSPYYCLLEGGRDGWLIHEMKDLFYYAQILHQGENTTATRIVSDKVSAKQIPNLMRAVGFYPSNEDIEILMSEISYRNYAESGQIIEEITFEEFVKFYINHRPAFGISLRELQEAFQVFLNPSGDPSLNVGNPVLTRNQFLNILFGKGPVEEPQSRSKDFGERLLPQEARMYLKFLCGCDDNMQNTNDDNKDERSILQKFTFLPEVCIILQPIQHFL
ncbi:WD repeat-containing protein 66 [Dufourea novaeangliae]|uniref:Cilia- and flagella-associated protein 251 n=1 Tax=Dufourea novaeangliae TaxID=178035 RepID=A0A154P067_DUFNO|nr:WD repeat-containing protein 66 [Dufourea novaeangliae]